MFHVLINVVVVILVVLLVLCLLWVIAFSIHIARDEIARENKDYSKHRIDIVINTIGNLGLRIIEKIYQLVRHSK